MFLRTLHAQKELDMDVDWSHGQRIDHVERDSEQYVTMYGTERNGELYYYILDRELVERIKLI